MQSNGQEAQRMDADQSASLYPDTGTPISLEQIDAYLAGIAKDGYKRETIRSYQSILYAFYEMLPDSKRVGPATLAGWSAAMREKGYKPRTINVRISSVNNLLKFLDLREYQLPQCMVPAGEAQPEISRNEYLRLLSCAKILGQECVYLLTKLFACTGLNVENLPLLTVEAVQAGFINTSDGEQREIHIPTHLQAELTAYIRRSGIRTGPVFVTRTGKRISRTSVTASIQRLARDARVAPEKCTPRSLRRLYQTTWESIQANYMPLMERSYAQLLDGEQLVIGWEEWNDMHE